MPILMHWNLSLTFFPFVLVLILAALKTLDLLKENSGNRKFRPGNHRSFERKLWEQEISTDGPGPVGLNAELRNHKSFKRKLWEQEIFGLEPIDLLKENFGIGNFDRLGPMIRISF